MAFIIEGKIIKNDPTGAIFLAGQPDPVSVQLQNKANGDTVKLQLFLDGDLYENRSFNGILTAQYEEEPGQQKEDEVIIVMEEDGSVDDLVDILTENAGRLARIEISSVN